MRFPKTLDDEDMELAQKEWRLAGFAVKRIAKRVIEEVVVSHRGRMFDEPAFAIYVHRERGGWVDVPMALTRDASTAQKIADGYDFP